MAGGALSVQFASLLRMVFVQAQTLVQSLGQVNSTYHATRPGREMKMSQVGMPDLIYEKFPEKHYAIFTMNRPERLNTSGGDLPRLLDEALADFTADSNMYVGILTGVGRAFSAGMDLRDWAYRDEDIAEVNAKHRGGRR